MESTIPNLTVQTLKAQIELRQLQCKILADEIAAAATFRERAALAYRWDETLKAGYTLRLLRDLLERQQKQGPKGPGRGQRTR
ncbi:MAG: hypothetical protein WB341_04925 [Terracidiphilus sp.]